MILRSVCNSLAKRGTYRTVHLQDADVSLAPPINSPEFWRRPERVAASSDPDTATAPTIRIMCDHVKRAAFDEGLRNAAHEALQRFGAGRDEESQARAAFWWCKHFIK